MKKKLGFGKVVFTSLCALTFVVSVSVARAGDQDQIQRDKDHGHEMGTGVGNGGDGAHAAYIEKLKRELGVHGVHDRNRTVDSVSEWCSNVTRILRREQGRSEMQLNHGQFAIAERTLKDALTVASESMDDNPDLGNPMTKRMVDRGVVYADGIETALATGSYSETGNLVTEIYFLKGFIDLIVQVERDVDHPYYIPYAYKYRHCNEAECRGEFDFRAFMARYLDYVKSELNFVREYMTHRDFVEGELKITPAGRPEAFLKLAELSSGFLADEISNTLDAYRDACAIVDLQGLSSTLVDFNLYNDRSIYPTFHDALAQVTEELDNISKELNVTSCGFERRDSR